VKNYPGQKIRLGFYHHIPITVKGNQLFIIGHMGRFLDGLASECSHLVLFMNEATESDNTADYCLRNTNITWINMGSRKSAPHYTLFGGKYRQIIKDHLSQIDAMLIRGPTPLLPPLAKINRLIPTALLIGGDYLAGMPSSRQPFLRKSLVWLWSWIYNFQQLQVAKKCLTMVNSHKLYSEMKPYLTDLVETQTTTLSDKDSVWREDTCQGERIRLLYTGRMDHAKGILDMLDALYELVEIGENVELHLVGMEEKGDTVLQELQKKATHLSLSERVIFHGYKPVGPELFSFYKNSDIYLLASQSSFEGFPRTIWEALAHSLPVIATKVGSIPDFLTNNRNALLVDPNSSHQLAQAILRLIHDGELRRKIIRNGFEVPKNNTIEKRSLEQVSYIVEYIQQKKHQHR